MYRQTKRKSQTLSITKTYLYNFDPLQPHFYIVKLGFTGVYIIFLISAQKHIYCGYSLESTIYVLCRNMKNIRILFENFQFLVVKFSIYLNRRVFVMKCTKCIHFLQRSRNIPKKGFISQRHRKIPNQKKKKKKNIKKPTRLIEFVHPK